MGWGCAGILAKIRDSALRCKCQSISEHFNSTGLGGAGEPQNAISDKMIEYQYIGV